ncbi:MAG: GNAT family N-acetyltransferase [Acidobacteria bacterium]|nr:GNAT family N-acetyltransferase [Acidobacteriota bacterium]
MIRYLLFTVQDLRFTGDGCAQENPLAPLLRPGGGQRARPARGRARGRPEPDQTGHITTLGVAPEHRRRRIAEGMLLKVEEAFRRRGLRTARLEVRSVNAGAQQLYRNLGYTVTQRLPRYYSNGGDGLLMVKALD